MGTGSCPFVPNRYRLQAAMCKFIGVGSMGGTVSYLREQYPGTRRALPGAASRPRSYSDLSRSVDAPQGILALQRSAGNRAVTELLLGGSRISLQRGGAVSTAIGVGAGGAGRGYAMRVLSQCPPGSIGHVMRTAIAPFWHLFGNVASGAIGRHYFSILPRLMAPATRHGLIRVAITETRWWLLQPGVPGFVGSMMSQRVRAHILIRMARMLGIRL